jgi:hypothetical protein
VKDEQNALIRAQELRDQYDGRVSVEEIAEKINAENPHLGAYALAHVFAAKAQKSPTLPEPEQDALFQARDWYKIDDAQNGWQWVPGGLLSTSELETIFNRVVRDAKTQVFRAERGLKDCKTLKAWSGYNPKLPHNENVKRYALELETKGSKAIEGGDNDDQAAIPDQ